MYRWVNDLLIEKLRKAAIIEEKLGYFFNR